MSGRPSVAWAPLRGGQSASIANPAKKNATEASIVESA